MGDYNQALLAHNIYCIFLSISQYIGYASATTFLIVAHDANKENKKEPIFSFLLMLSIISSIILIIPILGFLPHIIKAYGIEPMYFLLIEKYLTIGLILVVIYSIFYFIVTTMNGEGNHLKAFILSFSFLLALFTVNFLVLTKNHFSYSSLISLAVFKVILLSFLIFIFLYYSISKIKLLGKSALKTSLYKIWWSELASGAITALYPIVFSFQLSVIDKQNSLIITYQLILQLTAILCIPLMCSIQTNLSKASLHHGKMGSHSWWKNILFLGLIPTILLLIGCLLFNKEILSHVYHYTVPTYHESYIVLFIIATMIGQIGNALTTILRARRKSHLVTLIYYLSDIVFFLLVVQLFILLNWKSPFMVGVSTLIYVIMYTLSVIFFLRRKYV